MGDEQLGEVKDQPRRYGLMSARFRATGYPRSPYDVLQPQMVDVQLETDGTTVWFMSDPSRSHPLAFTPAGWTEIAGHSRRLVDDANAAWAAMGAL